MHPLGLETHWLMQYESLCLVREHTFYGVFIAYVEVLHEVRLKMSSQNEGMETYLSCRQRREEVQQFSSSLPVDV